MIENIGVNKTKNIPLSAFQGSPQKDALKVKSPFCEQVSRERDTKNTIVCVIFNSVQ